MGDGRLKSGSPDSAEPDAGGQDSPSAFSMTEIFERECGYYLHLGMSLDLYWDGDCTAVKWYRDKRQHDWEQKNTEAWVQGMYIYRALAAIAPAIRPFTKYPEPLPYMDKPFDITKRQAKKTEQDRKKQQMEAGFAVFKAIADGINIKRKEGGGDDGGGT